MIRALAFLLAIGMVVVGFVLREDTAPVAGTDPPIGAASAGSRVWCDAELEVACRAISGGGHDVTVEPAGDSYESLRGATTADAPDAWLAIAPWPAMVDEARTRGGLAGLFGPLGPVLATSPLVVVIWDERAAALEGTCPAGELDLACVTDAAGGRWQDLGGEEAWGAFKFGLSDPTTSSIALAALGVATVGQLGTADFGTRDLEQGSYLDWLTALAGAVPDFSPAGGSALAAMLQVGPATFDLATTTEAAVLEARQGGAQRADQLRVLALDTPATVDVVLAVRGDLEDAEAIARLASDALADASWHTPDTAPDAPDPGTAALDGPAGASLPSAGSLTALRNTFDDTVRR
jgi:hypothetical protein